MTTNTALRTVAVAAAFAIGTAWPVAAQSVVATETAAAPTSGAAAQNVSTSRIERLDTFLGLDGSKQPQDLGINANIGPRAAINMSLQAIRRAGIGVTVGQAVNVADAAVSVLERIDGTSGRTQSFTSVGIYQLTGRLIWRFGYDLLHQSYFDRVWLGQWRGSAGWMLGSRDELAAWFTMPSRSSDARLGDTTVRLQSMAQAAGVLRHRWPSGARTGLWAGVSRGHHDVVLVFPENDPARPAFVYGADLLMPLNDRWSVVGATNLVTPAASGTVDAFMGVTVNFGRMPRADLRTPGAADIANNTTFPVDLSRR